MHDITQAIALIDGIQSEAVLADKGYSALFFVEHIRAQGSLPVIPPKSNQTVPWNTDFVRYKERHLVECFINKIKHFRRLFSRFEKLAVRYMAFLQFVATLVWLK